MKNTTTIYGTIERETEKAILVNLTYEHPSTMSRKSWKAWMPKSQITVTPNSEDMAFLGTSVISAAGWLADKIANEISRFLGMAPTGSKGLFA